jgi:NCAIR mutase (PurE)-related protein
LREVLEKLARGEISVEDAERALKINYVENLSSIARLDVGRENRRRVPEMIFAEGKSIDDLLRICNSMFEATGRAIITRLNESQLRDLERKFGEHRIHRPPHSTSMVIKREGFMERHDGGRVGILTAGTVDLGIAEEAALVAREMGCETYMEADAGVAGIHRLVEPLKRMIEYDIDSLIVVAGREGALPTVVAGLTDVPLIAVPASSGYGYGGHGEAALMAMLQACSLGIAVVNIDSGIAAGVVAAQIANRVARVRSRA